MHHVKLVRYYRCESKMYFIVEGERMDGFPLTTAIA
jgi:hypothetical protein